MRIPGFGRDRREDAVETATGSTTTGAPDPGRAGLAADPSSAYAQGRTDARREDARALERERERTALERERRTRRRGHPLLALILVVLAIIGAITIYFVVKSGSAQQGGAAIDNQLSTATAPARDAVKSVRETTGQAVENAGAALQNSGEKIKP